MRVKLSKHTRKDEILLEKIQDLKKSMEELKTEIRDLSLCLEDLHRVIEGLEDFKDRSFYSLGTYD